MTAPRNEVVERLWKDSIDMHIHPLPDPNVERRVNSLDAALLAQDAGMRAIVLKSHYYPTPALAAIAARAAPRVAVIGSCGLDVETGGLDVEPVETQARLGAKVIWMPTLSAAGFRSARGLEGGIAISDSKGKILPAVTRILEMIKSYNMVLCSGHLSVGETALLFDEAKRLGLAKLVMTHPLTLQMTSDDIEKMAAKGAYVEHCFRCCMPLSKFRHNPSMIADAIRMVGAERTIMSTDFGEVTDPTPAEGMRMYIATMLQLGLSENEIELMVKVNPASLLDLD